MFRSRRGVLSLTVALPLVAVAGILAVPGRVPAGPAGTPPAVVALDGAIAFFEARFGRDSSDILSPAALSDRYLTRFGVARDIEDVRRAARVVRAGLARHEGYAPYLSRLATIHLARHEFPEALAAAREAYRRAPRRGANGPLFDAYFEVGAYDSARAALDRMNPNAFGYLVRETRLAEQVGRMDIAERAVGRACRPAGLSAPALRAWCGVRIAHVAMAAGRLAEADALLREALGAVPAHPAAVALLADVSFRRGDLAEAERWFRIEAAQPMGADARLHLARLALLAGDSARARTERARFELDARDGRYGRSYWSHLARLYAVTGRPAEALDLSARDLAQRPGPEAYLTRAMVLYHTGRFEAAQRAIDAVRRWGPGGPEVTYYTGLIAWAAGRETAGRAMLRRALRDPAGLDPDYRVVARRILSGGIWTP